MESGVPINSTDEKHTRKFIRIIRVLLKLFEKHKGRKPNDFES